MEQLRQFMERGEGSREDFEFLLINHVLLDSISRLARQDVPERRRVIRKLREYVKRNIPNLAACSSFRAESGSRRTVMRMNYKGLEDAAQLMLKIKKLLSY